MGSEFRVTELIRILWRRKFTIAAITLIAIVPIVALVVTLPRQYTAQGVLQVEDKQSPIPELQGIIDSSLPDLAKVRSATQVLTSWSLADMVAKKLNLADDPRFNPTLPDPNASWVDAIQPGAWLNQLIHNLPFMPKKPAQPITEAQIDAAVVGNVLDKLTIDSDGKSYIIYVSFTGRDPVTAAAIVNSIMQSHIDRELAARNGSAGDANSFLAQRAQELRKQLEDADAKVQDYMTRHDLMETKQGTVSQQQLADLNAQLSIARTDRAKAQARYQEAMKIRKGGVTTAEAVEVLDSPLIQSLTQREAELSQTLTNAMARLGPKHPERRAAELELANLRAKIAAETNKIIASLGSQAAIAVAGEQALESKIAELTKNATKTAQADVILQSLQKDADTKRQIYTTFLTRMEDTADPQQVQRPDARIISAAVPPTSPSSPRLPVFIAFGAIAAILLACAAVLGRERLKRGFGTLDEIVTTTGLPGFASVPEVRRRGSPVDFILTNPTSELAETIRGIRARLKLSGLDRPVKIVLVTSAMPEEGKTSFAASFARLSARDGQRVLLVEGDLRRPKIGPMFGSGEWRAWQDALSGTESIDNFVGIDPHSGLHFLAAREERESRMDLFESAMFRNLLRAAGRLYDFVVIDSPPVLHVSDPLVLAQHADAILLVVRANRTPRAVVSEAIRRLSATGKPIGIVGSRMAQPLHGDGIYIGYSHRGAA
jgi:capsular exopolysaccharide synthesis family protein